MLGIRERGLYGQKYYSDLCAFIRAEAKTRGVKVRLMQSNYEGDIVTAIQKALGRFDGIIINAGAYTHTSIAILDALKSVNIPTAEVHITDVNSREDFRKKSFVSMAAIVTVCGKGFDGYIEAMDALIAENKKNNSNHKA